MSGTMGTVEERNEITQIYKVDVKDIPPHYPSQRAKQELKVVWKESFYQEFIAEIGKIKKKNRPVLALLKSIKESNEFAELLTK